MNEEWRIAMSFFLLFLPLDLFTESDPITCFVKCDVIVDTNRLENIKLD